MDELAYFHQMDAATLIHGALFMMGAFVSWMLLNYLGIGYFPALVIARGAAEPPINTRLR